MTIGYPTQFQYFWLLSLASNEIVVQNRLLKRLTQVIMTIHKKVVFLPSQANITDKTEEKKRYICVRHTPSSFYNACILLDILILILYFKSEFYWLTKNQSGRRSMPRNLEKCAYIYIIQWCIGLPRVNATCSSAHYILLCPESEQYKII